MIKAYLHEAQMSTPYVVFWQVQEPDTGGLPIGAALLLSNKIGRG
jgi:hypothetical protein